MSAYSEYRSLCYVDTGNMLVLPNEGGVKVIKEFPAFKSLYMKHTSRIHMYG